MKVKKAVLLWYVLIIMGITQAIIGIIVTYDIYPLPDLWYLEWMPSLISVLCFCIYLTPGVYGSWRLFYRDYRRKRYGKRLAKLSIDFLNPNLSDKKKRRIEKKIKRIREELRK